MKKAFDQTVRDLKREVNKKVLKLASVEQKTLDATSNEPWGPHGSLLAEIAQATRNYHDYQLIMAVLWKRTQSTGKNWRHVYKALSVLEYLVVHGSERVIDDVKEHAYQISALSDFLYTDSNGRDQGSNIRRKSQNIVALINNKEKLREIRLKALSRDNRTSRRALSSSGSYDEERFEFHVGNVNDAYRKERELAHKFTDTGSRDMKYTQNVNPCGENISELTSRDEKNKAFGDNDCSYRYSSKSVDERTQRFYDDDCPSNSSGGDREDGNSQDERLFENKLSGIDAPPSYEEATRDSLSNAQDDKNAGSVTTSLPKTSSPLAPKKSKFNDQNPYNNLTAKSVPAHEKQVDSFEEFDPRGPESGSSLEDIFGLSTAESTDSLAPMTVIPSTASEVNIVANSALGANFATTSTTFIVSCEADENPFGDAPFKALPHEDSASQRQKSFSPTSSHASHGVVSNVETISQEDSKTEESQNFKFQKAPELFAMEDHSSDDILDGILPRTSQYHFPPTPGFSAHSAPHAPQNSQNISPLAEVCQINPFEQLELSNHLTTPALTCQPLQLDPSPEMQSIHTCSLEKTRFPGQQTLLDAPDCSRTVNPNSLHAQAFQHQYISVPLYSDAALGLTQFSQPPSNNKSQATEMNPIDIQCSSCTQPSQVTCVDLGSAHSALTSEDQRSQMNALQHLAISASLPSQTTPVSSTEFPHASSTGTQVAHMNSANQPGMMVSSPFLVEQSSFLANWHGAQMNPLEQENPLNQAVMTTPLSAPGVPASSNAFQSAGYGNIQTALVNPSEQTHLTGLLALRTTAASPLAGVYSAQTSENLRASSPAVPSNLQSGQSSSSPQLVPPPAKAQPSKDKFEPKSAVWADTLGRGLVDLNISGPKTNPLAGIGIDFDAINRKEKRNEAKSSQAPLTSNITMGKAMGAGRRAAAGAVSQHFNQPMGSYGGMGMYGGGMGAMGMGGYGGNMHQPSMAMGMTMARPGMPQQGHPTPGSYNPMNNGGQQGNKPL
ncbi:hypothetical protein HPP92_008613 [Vanilla planifolia]|uniref:ENTH domain-containing protein n=1 Tax=Vanilla planifolia TaxID=51239 RepID=A0A835R515_VANPL|nr:hypothetical protein HPP92_008613 [Vanilla planifolia]